MFPWVPTLGIVSWIGLFIHNVADIPGQTFLSPESLVPLLVTGVCIGLWFTAIRHVAAWVLLLWGLLNLAGAIITVLPLAILPFDPEQTLTHYAFHLLYGLTQLPVVMATAKWIRRRRALRQAQRFTR